MSMPEIGAATLIKPPDDPDYKLDVYWSKQFHKVHRRLPKNMTELRDFESSKHAESEALRQEEEKKRTEREKIETAKRLARVNLIRSRLQSRAEIPQGYSPPDSVQCLLEIIDSGGTYVAFTKIRGEKDKRILLDVDLEALNLEYTVFEFVDFSSKCNLDEANFKGSIFRNVTFQSNCSAKGTNFSASSFSSTKFSPDTHVLGASFKGSSFENGSYIDFDRNLILDAFFKDSRTDSWYKLSTPFSGIWQFINVALSSAYLISLYFKIQVFNGLSTTSQYARSVIEYEPTTIITLYEFVLGDSYSGAVAAFLILLYQILRLYITLKIGPMVESTKASGVTPEKFRFTGYLSITPLIKALGYLALVVFLWNFWLLLNTESLVY